MSATSLGISILMLPAGIALTVITILRMRSGRIQLSQRAKILLVVGMILTQVILVAGMMPVSVFQAIEDVFISTEQHAVAPLDPSSPAIDP